MCGYLWWFYTESALMRTQCPDAVQNLYSCLQDFASNLQEHRRDAKIRGEVLSQKAPGLIDIYSSNKAAREHSKDSVPEQTVGIIIWGRGKSLRCFIWITTYPHLGAIYHDRERREGEGGKLATVFSASYLYHSPFCSPWQVHASQSREITARHEAFAPPHGS